jgi:uncharacterized membrane protein HdeD (DUF308 family)
VAIVLASNWWALALRGVAGIIFGIIAFVVPGAAIAALVIVFGAYALVDGIFALVAAVRAGREHARWGALALEGIVGIIVGAWTFLAPGLTAVALVVLIGAWAVITGALEIAAAIRLRKTIRGEWLLGLAGVFSVLFGIVLWIAPIAGAVVLAWWIGAYAVVFGVMQLALAFRLRKWIRLLDQARPTVVRAA